MDPAIQAVGGLRIDVVGVQDQAAESRLDMAARAAEPVVEIEVAESGIEVVAPQQADHPPAKPDAFGVAGRSVEDALGLGEFVDFLGFLGGVQTSGRRLLLGGFSRSFSTTAMITSSRYVSTRTIGT